LSSSEEIQEVFESDIRAKEKQVGLHSLYDNFKGFQIEKFPDIVSATDRELLQRIFQKDTAWQEEENVYLKFSEEDKQRFGEIIYKIAEGDNDVE